MAGQLIIDGYNAIHALSDLRNRLSKGLEHARDGLIKLAREWRAQHPSWNILIVYDGQSEALGNFQSLSAGASGVKCVFTSSRVEADERIKQVIRNQSPRIETIVITRDREILACCRDHGIRFENPDFLLKKSAPAERRGGAKKEMIADKNKKEISDWYRDALKKKGAI